MSQREKAKEKICPIFTVINMLSKPGAVPDDGHVIIKCLGENCGVWSRMIEGCGLKSAK